MDWAGNQRGYSSSVFLYKTKQAANVCVLTEWTKIERNLNVKLHLLCSRAWLVCVRRAANTNKIKVYRIFVVWLTFVNCVAILLCSSWYAFLALRLSWYSWVNLSWHTDSNISAFVLICLAVCSHSSITERQAFIIWLPVHCQRMIDRWLMVEWNGKNCYVNHFRVKRRNGGKLQAVGTQVEEYSSVRSLWGISASIKSMLLLHTCGIIFAIFESKLTVLLSLLTSP